MNQTEDELYHFGILGMKWGVRRFEGKDGRLTSAGKKRYSIFNKSDRKKMRKDFDEKIQNGAKIATRLAIGVGVAYALKKTGALDKGKSYILAKGPGLASGVGDKMKTKMSDIMEKRKEARAEAKANKSDKPKKSVASAFKQAFSEDLNKKKQQINDNSKKQSNPENNPKFIGPKLTDRASSATRSIAEANKFAKKKKNKADSQKRSNAKTIEGIKKTADKILTGAKQNVSESLKKLPGTHKKAVSSSVESFKAKRNGRVSEATADIYSANKKKAMTKANSKQKKRIDVGSAIGSGAKKIGSVIGDKTIGAAKRANNRVKENRAQERHDRRRERGRHADTSWEDKVVQNTIKNASATYDSIINGAKQQSMKTGKWAFQEIPGSAKNVAISKAMDSIGAHLIDYTKELIGETKTAERSRKVGTTATTIASKLPKPKRKKSEKSVWDSMLDWANS